MGGELHTSSVDLQLLAADLTSTEREGGRKKERGGIERSREREKGGRDRGGGRESGEEGKEEGESGREGERRRERTGHFALWIHTAFISHPPSLIPT